MYTVIPIEQTAEIYMRRYSHEQDYLTFPGLAYRLHLCEAMEWDYPRALPQTFPLELNQTLLPLPHFLNPLTTVGTEVTQAQYTS